MIYFWSDQHFNHYNIIDLCHRPYQTVSEMNDDLIRRWNSRVTPDDQIYCLGDFGFKPREGDKYDRLKHGDDLEAVFAQLQGKKHLISGNHDFQNLQVFGLGWKGIHQIAELKCQSHRFVLCHYPLESWAGMWRGSLHLHGHCHGTLKRKISHRFDVGVDVFQEPVSVEEIVELAKDQKLEPQDG